MIKHTPGPWNAHHHESTDTYTIHVAGRSWETFAVAHVGDCTQDEANARLIAAAPELLALLAQALNFIEHREANLGKLTTDEEWDANVAEYRKRGISGVGIGRSYTDKAFVNLDAIRAAIAKATGDSQ